MSPRPNSFPTKARAHVLCAISQTKFRQTAAFILENKLKGAEVTESANVGEALEQLLSGKTYDALILDHPDGSDAILKLLRATRNSIPLYVLLTRESASDIDIEGLNIVGQYKGATLLESLLADLSTHLAAKLAGEEKSPAQDSADDNQIEADAGRFVRIRVELIDRKIPLQSDIFIRLGTRKFLKIFNRGDSFDRQDSHKYLVEKNIPYLYVERAEAGVVIDQINDKFNRLLSAEKPGELDTNFSTSVHEVALEIITNSGLTPEVQGLVRNNVMLVVKSMATKPRLKSILSKITVDREKYISSHSVALAQLTCSLAAAMDWGSSSTFHKLTLAAFMHDIDAQSQELAQLQTRAEIGALSEKYAGNELKEYTLHPIRASNLSKTLEEVPPDVDTVIAQHHERPDGSGFPRGLTHSQIHPLSALFIVAHDVLSEVIKTGEAFSMDDFIRQRADLYAQGNFKQVLKSLKPAMAKNDLSAT